ncbi:hypothetical protein [Paenibacillus sp. UMB4589-SE434]|uniref:hypothetical protein n=1 Tax=Paenibacillus sp. UMB4589-SE434 TaxID=3046314 RepID=UPI00254B6BE7|nr:hypothetical protein [Paenibacillus sp. UMB4589-SE434]MDK8181714.1 hypothetical protein [Paenibacillus sp. UMB4589-SE434]
MTDVIYFIDEKGEPVPCELLPREKETFKGRRLEDVEEFLALKTLDRARHEEESTRVQRDAQIEDTVEKAKRKQSERQKQQPYVSPSNRGKVSKAEREAEKNAKSRNGEI